MKIFFILLLISSKVFALTPSFPHQDSGPDGGRFNNIEIFKIENTIRNQLSNKENLSFEQIAELQNLETILITGKRAILWFEKINELRSPENKLELTVNGTSKGIPLTSPMKTNTEILIERYKKVLNEISPIVAQTIASSEELPNTTPVSDEEFVKSIRAVDVVYQHTIRWSRSKNNLSYYINRSLFDVRGYLFLKNTSDLENKLNNWENLSLTDKTNFSSWLFSLCHNGDFDDSDCKEELNKAILKNRAFSFYQRFNKYGENQYKSFFKISSIRSEIFWNQDKTILYSPFLSPERLDVKNWLSDNISDGWKGIGFNLVLDFKNSSNQNIPHIEFKSGVTAHVNHIAGDTITMDGDYSLNNYSQRWTIRHEYGHILGFTDCYLEFFDVNEKAMLYYEIDIDNLMCSRRGNLRSEHINELKNAYK